MLAHTWVLVILFTSYLFAALGGSNRPTFENVDENNFLEFVKRYDMTLLKLYDEESSNKDDDFVLKLFPKLQSHLHLHRIGYAQTELLRGGALPMDTVESLMPNLGQLNLPIYAMFLKDGLTNTVLSDKGDNAEKYVTFLKHYLDGYFPKLQGREIGKLCEDAHLMDFNCYALSTDDKLLEQQIKQLAFTHQVFVHPFSGSTMELRKSVPHDVQKEFIHQLSPIMSDGKFKDLVLKSFDLHKFAVDDVNALFHLHKKHMLQVYEPFHMETVSKDFHNLKHVTFLFANDIKELEDVKNINKENIPHELGVLSHFVSVIPDKWEDKDMLESILNFFHIKREDFPAAMTLTTTNGQKKYLLKNEGGKLSAARIIDWLGSFLNGEETPIYPSEDEFDDDMSGDVKRFVGTSFQRNVIDNPKAVFTFINMPGCGACSNFESVFNDLRAKYHENDLVFGKMDGTQNEIEGLEVSQFPTLVCKLAGEGKELNTFEGSLSQCEVKNFIQEHCLGRPNDIEPCETTGEGGYEDIHEEM